MTPLAEPRREKPLLRGVSHEVAAALALAAWVALAVLAPGSRARLAANVYGASLFALFGVSALYHRPRWRAGARRWLKRVDHAAIFLLIAGSYTPFCLLLPPSRGIPMLAVAWAGAALGIGQAVFWVGAPRAVGVALYVVLGWLAVLLVPALVPALGAPAVALLAAGGVVYTLGAVVYAARRPDPFPRVFGYHEVFHAMVIVAAACQLVVVAGALRAMG
ncbi:MAG TPA: hemolysin III family protein [Anaeromyxobacteraceae bacterium]|nr:hemolysin III family protein [Anaeromyxobacteraceae bacterium]